MVLCAPIRRVRSQHAIDTSCAFRSRSEVRSSLRRYAAMPMQRAPRERMECTPDGPQEADPGLRIFSNGGLRVAVLFCASPLGLDRRCLASRGMRSDAEQRPGAPPLTYTRVSRHGKCTVTPDFCRD